MKKIRVGIIFGGKSGEHEVSLESAKNIIAAIDKKKYDLVPIGIGKNGGWLTGQGASRLLESDEHKLPNRTKSISLLPSLTDPKIGPLDVVFPVLHGPYGEDGTIQGLLKLANIPFVGAGVLGSAIGMDKDVMKRLLREAGIPVVCFIVIKKGEKINFGKVAKDIGIPLFVKPANLGSSIGVSKVRNKKEFNKAIRDAFLYENKILLEEFIKGREIECSVLGNEKPIASLPGEVIPHHEFYSYKAKYIDENGAAFVVPAEISKNTADRIREMAVQTFKVLCCEGMGRVDFFVRSDGKIFVSEINTIPGFTKISMYPRLWKATGIPYSELIDKLIQLALQRFKRDSLLKTSFTLPS